MMDVDEPARNFRSETGEEHIALAPPVELGTALFSIVEPRPGYVADFSRWYERDHFFAGCMTGADFFSGRRFVATHDLKNNRIGEGVGDGRDITAGSFLHLYWILNSRRESALSWSVDQVRRLAKQGRMGPPTDNVSTGFYAFSGRTASPDGDIPAELALEYPYASVAALLLQNTAGTGGEDAFRNAVNAALPAMLAAPLSQALWFRPLQLPVNAPRIAARVPQDELEQGWMILVFSNNTADAATWREGFASLKQRLRASSTGRVRMAACFRPVIPGIDDYTSRL